MPSKPQNSLRRDHLTSHRWGNIQPANSQSAFPEKQPAADLRTLQRIDQRVRDHFITRDLIGDYVLSGGELAAAVLVDAIGRLIPGVLNNVETSALTDSFQDNLLAPPVYSRPEEFRGMESTDVLLSGNHKLIDEWRSRTIGEGNGRNEG